MSEPALDLAVATERPSRPAGRRLGRSPSLVVGVVLVTFFALLALAAPWIAGDPNRALDPIAGKRLPPGSVRIQLDLAGDRGSRLAESAVRQGDRLVVEWNGRQRSYRASEIANLEPDGSPPPPRRFLLGTDRFSRDVWARVLHGGRVSLSIGLLSMLVAVVAGALVGTVAGMSNEWVDNVLMRITDACLAIPRIFLVLLLVALFDPGVVALVVVIGGTSWMVAARLVRAEILSLRQRSFVTAARGLGAGPLRLALVHLLPNALTPLAVYAGVLVGGVILLESALSFLGLGVPQPTPSWGAMLDEGRRQLSAWWMTTMPGLALVGTVIGFHLLSDGLRDLLDPRDRR
jgi:peptide/nickel transport system permease protein